MPLYRRTYGGGGYTFNIGDYFPRAIKTICIACIAVFFLQVVSRFALGPAGWNFWLEWFGLVPKDVTHFGFVWQLGTYLFLHATIWHILFNLLYLAMFGADLEHSWGARKFTTYFFLCGVGAGLIDVGVRTALDPHAVAGSVIPTIGASGAIYGVLLACAVIMPHRQVYLFPLPVTISMRLLVIILGAIEFISTFGLTGDNVSHVCHLGGMLVGYIYLRRGSFLYNVRNQVSDYQRRRLRRKFEVYARDHKNEPPSRPDNWVN
ncbi:MAG TPA: rhomboid family intramembrane serine protease [Candidatus Acidoferrales bacterium]|nr:rhomboid family intramembrane serine protease [Candidatus Acidoferrales bacterium]